MQEADAVQKDGALRTFAELSVWTILALERRVRHCLAFFCFPRLKLSSGGQLGGSAWGTRHEAFRQCRFRSKFYACEGSCFGQLVALRVEGSTIPSSTHPYWTSDRRASGSRTGCVVRFPTRASHITTGVHKTDRQRKQNRLNQSKHFSSFLSYVISFMSATIYTLISFCREDLDSPKPNKTLGLYESTDF